MLSIRHSYTKYYKKEVDELSIPFVSRKVYGHLCSDFMKFIVSKILSGHIVRLPARIGRIFIRGTKQKIRKKEDGTFKLPIDWAKTKLLWSKNEKAKLEKRLIYYTNEHTNGYLYSAYWDKKYAILKNKSFYKFKMAREANRTIKKKISEGIEYLLKL